MRRPPGWVCSAPSRRPGLSIGPAEEGLYRGWERSDTDGSDGVGGYIAELAVVTLIEHSRNIEHVKILIKTAVERDTMVRLVSRIGIRYLFSCRYFAIDTSQFETSIDSPLGWEESHMRDCW